MSIPPADLTPFLPARRSPCAMRRRMVITVIREPVLVSPPTAPVVIDASRPEHSDGLPWVLFSGALVMLAVLVAAMWVR